MGLSILFLMAMSQSGASSVALAGLTVDPVISEATYCQVTGGHISLRLRFILHYQNTSKSTIVLPMFSVPSGYELFRGEAEFDLDRKERSLTLHRRDVLDAAKLDLSKPDPKLFWTLRPGEAVSAYQELWIDVEPTKEFGTSLLGNDHYLRVRMNPWPAKRTVGEKLRKLWQSHGLLWLDEVESQPLKFHVPHSPRVDGCRSYVD
jgi:hypothetical protein